MIENANYLLHVTIHILCFDIPVRHGIPMLHTVMLRLTEVCLLVGITTLEFVHVQPIYVVSLSSHSTVILDAAQLNNTQINQFWAKQYSFPLLFVVQLICLSASSCPGSFGFD
jgi:hypothetical protein